MHITWNPPQPGVSGLPPISSRATAEKSSSARCCRRAGFTLIELLTVMAILAILASITITVGRGVQERARIARAKADLAVLAAALESYKAQHGDYPWTPDDPPAGMTDPRWDGGAVLFNALSGLLTPQGALPTNEDGDPALRRSIVELTKFQLWSENAADLPDPENPKIVLNWFNDPWGKWYYYHYRRDAAGTATGNQWKRPGFLLYSHGPDGECNVGLPAAVGTPANTGLLENFPAGTESINADNLYYGR